MARTPAQEAPRPGVRRARRPPWDDGTVWLDAAATRERLDVAGARGATFTPHCARVHPRRLVDGLAAAVRRLGGAVVEGARVVRTADRVVVLDDGHRVTASTVVRRHRGLDRDACRDVAPGRPRCTRSWSPPSRSTTSAGRRVGLAGREVFADHGHVVIYGQRTDDGRIAFGGRGAPYHWGSAIRPEFDEEPSVFDALRTTLRDLLPQLDGIRFTHAWGGPLGIARDWHPSVTWDPVTRTGRAGGYVGDGVAASNLAGRTLADLVLGRGHRAHRAALGRAPLAALGARAAALARGQRRPAAGPARRPRGGPSPAPGTARRRARPAHRALTPPPRVRKRSAGAAAMRTHRG